MTGICKSYQAKWMAGTCFIALVAMPSVSHAQAGSSAPAAEESGGVQDIVVTARKRAENVQDIPVSIRAVDAEMIQRQDISGLEKLAAKAPELIIARSSNGSGASLTIRGVGSNFSSVGVEQSVAVIVDGAYYGHGRTIDEGFFDLARVEVLKGPQALFFGKNATAGVVSITTADPGDAFEGLARVGYEFRSQSVYAEAVASGPISDTLGIRVALRGSKMFGGYTHNLATQAFYNTIDVATGNVAALAAAPADRDQPGTKDLIGRVTLKWTPTEDLTNTLKISGTHSRGGASGFSTILGCAGPFGQRNPSLRCGAKFTTYFNDMPIEYKGATGLKDNKLYSDYDSFAVNDTLNYEINDDVTFTSVTNFNRNKVRYLQDYGQESDAGVWAAINSKFRAFSNESRILTSFDGPVNLLLGTYYQSSKRDHGEFVTFIGVINSAASPADKYLAFTKISPTKGETISAFGQAIWKIVPEVELTAGARYTHETKKSSFFQPYVNPALAGLFTPQTNNPATTLHRDQTFNNWSPEATITWRPTKDMTVYAAYKTGYKSGGFSNSGILSPADPNGDGMTFAPEKAKGFEGGIKTTLLDRQLRFNIGVYRYTYSGLQVDYFDPLSIRYITRNAGSSKTRGIETELEFVPRSIDGLTIRSTLNYNRSRYSNFLAPCWQGQSLGQGCVLQTLPGQTASQFLQQLGGRPTANAPKLTGSAGFEYDLPISSGMIFGLSSDFRFSSKYNSSAFDSPNGVQKSYSVIDASIRLRSESKGWELALIGKNLTNRQYKTGVFDITGTGSGTGSVGGGIQSDIFQLTQLPRTVQLQATYRF